MWVYAFKVTIFVRPFVPCIVCMCSYTGIGLIKVNWCIIRAVADTKEWLRTGRESISIQLQRTKLCEGDITVEW